MFAFQGKIIFGPWPKMRISWKGSFGRGRKGEMCMKGNFGRGRRRKNAKKRVSAMAENINIAQFWISATAEKIKNNNREARLALLMQAWKRFNCLREDKIKTCGFYLIKFAPQMQAWKRFNCLREDKIKMRGFYLTKPAPRVKSGIITGIEPCSIESFESSAMQHHSAKS